ncbi:MAG: bifunctional metallophosphatase/5'-nucleotidase, partial [Acholeplasmatales bacterium]|nr:bifunctional metallophosphatase/5'-nucleotidase [Acholeplasmatales bacterium]
MKYKIILLLILIFSLSSCTTTNKTNTSTESKNNNSVYPIGLQIQDEYNKLISNSTDNHTLWTFEGKVIDMTETKFNTRYNNYNVMLILDVDGVLIGIYNGFVDGTYPDNIDGLKVGTIVSVTGIIEENYQLTSGNYTALIEFSKPEISWDNNNEDNNNYNNVNFLMLNDTHGALTDSSEGYSIGRVDALVNQLEDKNGEYILIHNGDAFQGSYVCGETYGLPLIDALNEMDFDCFVLGNHEFDWGIDKISRYNDGDESNGEAKFPFLGANIYYKNTTTRPDWIDPYTIVNYGDIKVGIIGVIGKDQESSILTRYVEDYTFVDPIDLIEENASKLRNNENCDVVVVATHDYNDYLNEEIASLSSDSKIDSIFCGHTHELIRESVKRDDNKNIPIVQNYHKNNTAAEVVLSYDESLNYIDYDINIYYPESFEISSRIQAIINKYDYLIEESNEVLGYTGNNINKSKLGNFAINSLLNYDYSEYNFEGVDISIINTGGIRASISSGDITRADIFEVFPFNNMVVLVNINGKLLKSLIKDNIDYLYVDTTNEIGSYNNLDDNTIYQLAVIDYVFEGPYYDEFNNLSNKDYIQTDIILRDTLMEYIDDLYEQNEYLICMKDNFSSS